MSRRKTPAEDTSAPMESVGSDAITTLVDESLPNGEAVPQTSVQQQHDGEQTVKPRAKRGSNVSYAITGIQIGKVDVDILQRVKTRRSAQKYLDMAAQLLRRLYTDIRVVQTRDVTHLVTVPTAQVS